MCRQKTNKKHISCVNNVYKWTYTHPFIPSQGRRFWDDQTFVFRDFVFSSQDQFCCSDVKPGLHVGGHGAQSLSEWAVLDHGSMLCDSWVHDALRMWHTHTHTCMHKMMSGKKEWMRSKSNLNVEDWDCKHLSFKGMFRGRHKPSRTNTWKIRAQFAMVKEVFHSVGLVDFTCRGSDFHDRFHSFLWDELGWLVNLRNFKCFKLMASQLHWVWYHLNQSTM